MKIHENITTMRKRNTYSQSEVATKLEITRTAYGKIERGETSPNFKRLEDLCKIFGCTMDELINIQNNSHIEVEHIFPKGDIKSNYNNLISMTKLQHEYDHLLKHLYKIHREHFTREMLKEFKSKLETFIEQSHYQVADGFIDDFFAFLQQVEDAKQDANEL